jgi:cytochrome c-type biogenesis protein CcmE
MKKTRIAALLFVVIAIGAIISTVYKSDAYSNFTVAKDNPGREVNIIGTLSPGKEVSERVINNTLTLSFFLTDHLGNESQVTYFGAKPYDFEKSDQVVLIGRYEQDAFIASSILLKCPSKYEPERQEAVD